MIKPKKSLQLLHRYPVLQEGRYGKLRLDKNENTFGFPPRVIKEMLSGISPHFLAAYPEPYALYEKIAAWHQVKVENVLVTAGSEMAIRYLFECFLEPGAEIVLLDPSFAMFEVYAKMCGAKIVAIPYDRQLHVAPQEILRRISPRTKIVAIANPNNPTGTVVPQKDLVAIIAKAARHQALVLIDEAYFYFYTETMLPYCREFGNLVVTRTFSKACGLAGVRLGYAVANADLITEIRKLQPIDHASNFAIKLGEYLIDHEDLVWAYARAVEQGKRFLVGELSRRGVRCHGGFANFILIDLGEKKERVVEALRQRDILVGANLRLPFKSGYIRVTVGPLPQAKRFMAAFTELLDESSGRVDRTRVSSDDSVHF